MEAQARLGTDVKQSLPDRGSPPSSAGRNGDIGELLIAEASLQRAELIVLGGYGHSLNALDYVYHESNYKPCGFVSYGGASGSLRAVQVGKQLVTTPKMMPMVEGVAVAGIAKLLDEGKVL